jgi:hypothetical protein
MVSKSKVKATLFAATVATLAWAAVPAFATGTVCPAVTGQSGAGAGDEGINPAYTADLGAGDVNSCNVLITFEAGGSIVTTFPNASVSYDGGLDDNLIGIVNDTSAPISSITLSSTVDAIFEFDGDGVCATDGTDYDTFNGGTGASGYSNGCGAGEGSDPKDYAGPDVSSFSGINGSDTAGTVNFAGGIAGGGGSAYFALEGPVDLNLKVTPTVPEPNTFLLLGSGLLGLIEFGRRKLRV